ncbi:MAG: hypothetical protein H3C35_02315 [Bacteroidetes bacterium]|nr:hypothetical protein [Bacteroidota bacterium]
MRQQQKNIFTLAFFCFLFPLFLFSQNASVTATADSSVLTIGDWMNVHITATLPNDALVYFPGMRDTIGGFDIVKQDSLMRSVDGNVLSLQKTITVASFQEGIKTLPPISIAYRTPSDTAVKIIRSNPISIEVRTIAVDTTQAIKDIKSVMTIPLTWKDFALYGGIILVLAALAYVIYRRIQKRKISSGEIVEEKPLIPAHLLALQKLSDLGIEKLWQKGEVKLFYSKATEIIREYFELRYGITALEMTTSEVMEQLEKFKLNQSTTASISGFLSEADLVKFAKYFPASTDMEKIIPTAEAIVNNTRPTETAVLPQEESTSSHE